MMRPQPDSWAVTSGSAVGRKLTLRMNLRKTVSVTPAIGASTVAGAMRPAPIWKDDGTCTTGGAGRSTVVSQYLRMMLLLCLKSSAFHYRDSAPSSGQRTRVGK